MSRDEKPSGNIWLVLFMLGVIAAGGAWNYQRNLALEAANMGVRPFKGYSDEALVQLVGAYEEEARVLERKYRASLARREGVREQGGLIMDRVEEFERVQKQGKRIRAATMNVAERDARIREIREEERFRSNQDDFMLHLKRLTSI